MIFSALVFPTRGHADDDKGAVRVERGPFRLTLEADAILIPADGSTYSFWPKAFQGKGHIVKVAQHGSDVREGDVVLQLDGEAIEAAVQQAEWKVRSTEIALEAQRSGQDDLEKERRHTLEKAKEHLAHARKLRTGYLETERAMNERDFRLQERAYLQSIEDQEEEIAQLGKMYKEDELTEETEEIVLRRAKRRLESTHKRLVLFRDRRQYQQEYREPETLRQLENTVEEGEIRVSKLERSMPFEHEQAAIKLAQTEDALARARKRLEELREDQSQFTFRAPHDGIALHGNFLSRTPANGVERDVGLKTIRRGDVVATRQPILTVAKPGSLKAQFQLAAKDRYLLQPGASAVLSPEALPQETLSASVAALGKYPGADGTWRAHAVFGHDDPRLVPLLKCKVEAVLVDRPAVLTLPNEALFAKDGRWYCYVREGAPFGLGMRAVVPGPTDGKVTVIEEGLEEGNEVLVKGKAHSKERAHGGRTP